MVLKSHMSEPTALNQSRAHTMAYEIRPLEDARWRQFVENHPQSSVFHTAEWLEALRRTYGYEPVAFTTCPPGEELRNAAVFCRVESWLTGRRLVSLPFSDHCDFLADDEAEVSAIELALASQLQRENLRYVETRPLHSLDSRMFGTCSTYSYCWHHIDLEPSLDELFHSCHKDCTQRKIRRAEREELRYEEGQTESLLNSFYELVLLTRRRHTLISQPKRWFRSLIDSFGKSLKIRVAFKGKQGIAAILTLRHKDTLIYKYGCSDAQFHRLGGMHMLFWRSIQEAKRDGLCMFDLGRSECENTGLIKFKDRWGARCSLITYLRMLASTQSKGAFVPAGADWKERTVKKLLPHLPNRVLISAGGLIYRHIG
jgi:lipid II:glycine glycyltransferase (peptidoglycan interpeptide bridge formation enzyme)